MRTLVRLSVTPVKALRLSHPTETEITEGGIPGDRRFYLIDETGALFDATDHHALLRVVPDYEPATERLRLTFPDGSIVEDSADRTDGSETTDFFGRPVSGRIVHGPFAEALSSYVGAPLRFVRADREGEAQDVHPLTIVSSASVHDLGSHGEQPDLDARRFRITLEVAGCEPYEEDTWEGRDVRIGDATIRVRGQIPRCVVTTLAPDSGERDFRTLNILARHRPRIGGKGGLPFGMYAAAVRTGRVRLGDPVEPVSSSRSPTTTAAGR
jgi:uncharacterized protein YcbX